MQGEEEAEQAQEDLPVRVRVDVVQLSYKLRIARHTMVALVGQGRSSCYLHAHRQPPCLADIALALFVVLAGI